MTSKNESGDEKDIKGPLTETKLKQLQLRPRAKLYKVSDRDGLHAAVSPTGAISFRYSYRVNGRDETVTFGQWGIGGITLLEARDKLHEAKRAVRAGQSPAITKSREKNQVREQLSFGDWAAEWIKEAKVADSTRELRRSTYERELKHWANRMLGEIGAHDVRELTKKIKERGAPATAVLVRNIIVHVYRWASERGQECPSPAVQVRAHTIATFDARERNLSPAEIALFYKYLSRAKTALSNKAALKLVLLTLVRKSELAQAVWGEFSLDEGVWNIPAERMKKNGLPHVVYLSRQAVALLRELRVFAGMSDFVLPARYDPEKHISDATLNLGITATLAAAQEDGVTIPDFTVHDLRRTGSTQLNEAEYDFRWIEYCLAHHTKTVAATYNRAKWSKQRAAMLQDWADMIDGWTRPVIKLAVAA